MGVEKKVRYFSSAAEYFYMFGLVFRHMAGVRKIPETQRISPEFSERIMLAVTAVNECSNCSFLHTKTALEKGVELDTIHKILEGEIGSFSDDEMPAVLFGQHFAETSGQVSDAARAEFISAYGSRKAAHIEGFISAVCFGNLCSNTVEAWESGVINKAEKKSLFLAYMLSKPVAAGIRRGSRK